MLEYTSYGSGSSLLRSERRAWRSLLLLNSNYQYFRDRSKASGPTSIWFLMIVIIFQKYDSASIISLNYMHISYVPSKGSRLPAIRYDVGLVGSVSTWNLIEVVSNCTGLVQNILSSGALLTPFLDFDARHLALLCIARCQRDFLLRFGWLFFKTLLNKLPGKWESFHLLLCLFWQFLGFSN